MLYRVYLSLDRNFMLIYGPSFSYKKMLSSAFVNLFICQALSVGLFTYLSEIIVVKTHTDESNIICSALFVPIEVHKNQTITIWEFYAKFDNQLPHYWSHNSHYWLISIMLHDNLCFRKGYKKVLALCSH